jgi:hypothetical protein
MIQNFSINLGGKSTHVKLRFRHFFEIIFK